MAAVVLVTQWAKAPAATVIDLDHPQLSGHQNTIDRIQILQVQIEKKGKK